MFTLRVRRSLLLVAVLATAAGCGRDGTGPSGLTPEQVGGMYHICELDFTPNNPGLFPPVDIRATMDTTPEAAVPARLWVSEASREFALTYIRANLFNHHDGEYRTGRNNVEITFANPGMVLTRLLLPGVVNLEFQAQPRQLRFARSNHDVSGLAYATLRGLPGDDAPPTIRGTISGRFRVGGCD